MPILMLSRLMLLPLVLATAPTLAAPARLADPLALAMRGEPTDADLHAAWKRLDEPTRADLIEWFRAEASWLNTFQAGLVRYILENQDRDPGTWSAVAPAPTYDPTVHAPAQPIARKSMRPGKSADRARAKFFEAVPERRLRSAWVYDYSGRELQHTADLEDPERIFSNAVAGFPPDLDLAEALVERALDDGSQQATLTAFAHAYSDRGGNVIPGVTLYDAWSSGRDMEMPDVECLGILHDLKDDWRSFKAPVSGGKQARLYKQIGELFVPARHHRGLRTAFARCYVTGSPVLRDGYGESVDRFHALWDQQASTPSALHEELPDDKHWESFLEDLVKTNRKQKAVREAGERRRATLDRDATQVRTLLVRLMREAEYLKPAADAK